MQLRKPEAAGIVMGSEMTGVLNCVESGLNINNKEVMVKDDFSAVARWIQVKENALDNRYI